MKNVLSFEEIQWAYDMYCIGYTQNQIADALFVCEKTINRALKGKPRIRPILVYVKGSAGAVIPDKKFNSNNSEVMRNKEEE